MDESKCKLMVVTAVYIGIIMFVTGLSMVNRITGADLLVVDVTYALTLGGLAAMGIGAIGAIAYSGLRRNKWLRIAMPFIMIALLFTAYVSLPRYAYGSKQITVTLKLKYACGYGPQGNHTVYDYNHNMLVRYIGPDTPVVRNGTPIPADNIRFDVNYTNNLSIPVVIQYNGFRYVILIYNQTVENPEDVVANKPSLIWGGTSGHLYERSFDSYGNYEVYVSRMNATNFTTTIKPGTWKFTAFAGPLSIGPEWDGQSWVTGNRVSPGTYYIYAIAYGKVSQPVPLEIIEIPYKAGTYEGEK